MGDTYEKRARQKRKEQKRREKAAAKRAQKDLDPSERESEEEIAARYLDKPEEEEGEA
ncbi:MAG: hypothetical protein P1V36_02110 [Planctomycetota bacterium]|nr:hypothetical protein [Planctomycetota bacterium]